jgi:hypothetical protein
MKALTTAPRDDATTPKMPTGANDNAPELPPLDVAETVPLAADTWTCDGIWPPGNPPVNMG